MEHPSTLPTASLWRRLGAMLYDSLVVFAIWMMVGFGVLSMFGIDEARTLEGTQVVLDPLYQNTLFLAMLVSAYIFFAWFWTHSGQTLGMQAWKIKVQNKDGSAITYRQSLIRFGVAPLSFLLFGAGYLMMLFNADKSTLPDKLSHSVLVKIER